MKLFTNWFRNKERGQAILIIALAMVGIVAFVGIMTDGGVYLIEYGKMKRGIDAAAIAAAQQFRRGFNPADLVKTAQDFLALNESAVEDEDITIYRCAIELDPRPATGTALGDGTLHDEELCTTPFRKLVRVEAERDISFGFLRIIGWNGTTIRASSVGEAGSLDLVLVIDTSASMAYDTYTGPNADSSLDYDDSVDGDGSGNPVDDEDPAVCNTSVDTPCQPLAQVKDVALEFLDTMYFPYDRVAVVALTEQEQDGTATRNHTTILHLSDNQSDVEDAITSLKVFRPGDCIRDANEPNPDAPTNGICRNLDDSGVFKGFECARLRHSYFQDPSTCNSSNIGGALTRAWAEFTSEEITVRPDTVWAVILLAGGPANATDVPAASMTRLLAEGEPPLGWTPEPDYHPFGYCPSVSPPCRDGDGAVRHDPGDLDYDADDFARDSADSVADPDTGGGITIYTIGLGELIRKAKTSDPNEAEDLLQYIALNAGGSGPDVSHGLYYHAPNSSQLDEIFESIANDLFTRIAK